MRECAIGFGIVLAGVGVVEMKSGTSMLSFWRSERFAFTNLLKGIDEREPSRIGRMNLGQRRMHTFRKERISRPEYLDRVSQTMEQNLDQVSDVSLSPLGRGG